ncbi:MAG: SPOR domain-containing protein [Synergistaceae bacterium]|jgi:cell division septation protein DedD|nr:SPOR domain-containing protein [Synergistaceae bacterium]
MAATTRRARNYKEKSSGFTFGHFALPVAAVIALGLLFVGIKLFFLTPPQRAGIPTMEYVTPPVHNASTPVAQEPDFALADNVGVSGEFAAVEPEKLETTDVAIVLARPLSQPGGSVSSRASATSSSKVTKTDTRRAASAPAAKPQASSPVTSAQAAGAKSKWGVQVGAFVNEGSASTLVSEIKKHGYGASISRVDSSGKTFHRVRVGAGDTREDANRLAAELKQKGYPVDVVPMP